MPRPTRRSRSNKRSKRSRSKSRSQRRKSGRRSQRGGGAYSNANAYTKELVTNSFHVNVEDLPDAVELLLSLQSSGAPFTDQQINELRAALYLDAWGYSNPTLDADALLDDQTEIWNVYDNLSNGLTGENAQLNIDTLINMMIAKASV